MPGRGARGILRNVGCDITAKYIASPLLPLSLFLLYSPLLHTTPYAWDTQHASKRALKTARVYMYMVGNEDVKSFAHRNR